MYAKRKSNKPKRISKRRDPWYNKYLHFGKRLAAGASGGALGFLYDNVPGAIAGSQLAYNLVGPYKRPYRAKLASNYPILKPVLSSNPYPGSIRYKHPHYSRDPWPISKGPSSNPPKGTRSGAFKFTKNGWKYVGGRFTLGRKLSRGHRGKKLRTKKY